MPIDPIIVDSWKYLNTHDRLRSIARATIGWNLKKNPDDLAWLVGRFCDSPALAKNAAQWHTNCATTCLGWLARACLDQQRAVHCHPLLGTPSQNWRSLSWMTTIMREAGGDQYVRVYNDRGIDLKVPDPEELSFLWYASRPQRVDFEGRLINDDHVALYDPLFGCIYEGGGSGNSINVSDRNWRHIDGRKCIAYCPVSALDIPPAEQTPEEVAEIIQEQIKNLAMPYLEPIHGEQGISDTHEGDG